MDYQVKCQRCDTVNEFYVVESGPHLKAICNHCDRYIKFIPRETVSTTRDPTRETIKTPSEGSNPAPKKMANIISVRIDVMKIDKAKLFKGEKGTYLDVVLLMRDGVDTYGNNGMVVQQVTKEERAAGVKGAILGNAKIIGGGISEASPQGAAVSVPVAAPDDLPF